MGLFSKKIGPVFIKESSNKELFIQQLKEYGLKQSRSENVPAYFIFNDAQMNDLVDKCPNNKEELLKISGFGNVKVEKYGAEILKILNASCNNI